MESFDHFGRSGYQTHKEKRMNDWNDWFEKMKNQPKEPRTIFVDDVEDKLHEMTGDSLHMLFAVEDNPKADSDFSRIFEIIHDFFDEEASVDETASAIKDFLIHHGYINKN